MIYYFIAGYIKNFLTNLEYIRICLSKKILSLETLKKKFFLHKGKQLSGANFI